MLLSKSPNRSKNVPELPNCRLEVTWADLPLPVAPQSGSNNVYSPGPMDCITGSHSRRRIAAACSPEDKHNQQPVK